MRKSPRVSSSLPWLYLHGISTGNMDEVLSELLGEQVKGLSANVVTPTCSIRLSTASRYRSRRRFA
ncbi:hypothetical protein CJO66_00720 [Burkholderia ubonensis]|nr:hypothetical protein CJO71_02740 [Burkholderia ubonensis]PAJ84722.1 hypothetical protein CJO70_26475 [Burkholderia ubonensis]PAJ95349.1 hypothetical protein CJO69_07155 [Burkholderia ubonensis]PAJ97013.1 hypothetical protein CJO68_32410 [Burkholderia ubonensis]PAK09638.1 hypothetical protein CJO67_00740 [Burkholderia ubonensis]